jgi:hypothetical protein
MVKRLRFVARLLDGDKVVVLCCEFGISRKTGYRYSILERTISKNLMLARKSHLDSLKFPSWFVTSTELAQLECRAVPR